MIKTKILVILIIISIFCINAFSIENDIEENESILITDLKFINEKDSKRFYLVDHNGNKEYGFFEDEKYDFNKILIDKSIDFYNGRVKKSMLRMYYNSFNKYRNNITGMALAYSFAGLMIPGGACMLAFGAQREFNDSIKRILIANGVIFIIGGFAEFIIGIVASALTGFHYKRSNSLKKEILNSLNGRKTSLINNRYCNINLTFQVDFSAHYY